MRFKRPSFNFLLDADIRAATHGSAEGAMGARMIRTKCRSDAEPWIYVRQQSMKSELEHFEHNCRLLMFILLLTRLIAMFLCARSIFGQDDALQTRPAAEIFQG